MYVHMLYIPIYMCVCIDYVCIDYMYVCTYVGGWEGRYAGRWVGRYRMSKADVQVHV